MEPVKIFSGKFTVSSYDLNPQGRARLTTMAGFFQEIAYHHAGELGFGYDDMKQKQTMWVLSRMRIEMDRYPVWNDQITINTWHSGVDRLFALRDFRVVNSHGEVIGRAATAWLILDIESHRLIRPELEIDHVRMHRHQEHVFDEPMGKISLPPEMHLHNLHTVRFSDLDILGHVNNVKYMEWCIDAAMDGATRDQGILDQGILDQEIRELEINFNHEALIGDTIGIRQIATSPVHLCFSGVREEDGKEIFRALLRMNDQDNQ